MSMIRAAIVTAAASAALVGAAGPALAAADTGPNSRPTCIGLFSSSDDIRGDVSRAVYAHELKAFAEENGTTSGAAMHALIGGPGAKC
jgi:hypothetical protein